MSTIATAQYFMYERSRTRASRLRLEAGDIKFKQDRSVPLLASRV